jgi:hypothetical protein
MVTVKLSMGPLELQSVVASIPTFCPVVHVYVGEVHGRVTTPVDQLIPVGVLIKLTVMENG